MGVEEEVLLLKAEVQGIESYQQLERQLTEVNQWTAALKSTFAAGAISEAQFTEQTTKLLREEAKLSEQVAFLKGHFDRLAGSADVVELAMQDIAEKTGRADVGLARVGKSADGAKGGMSVLQQQIIAGSYAFQDFTSTSGDLGAKLNSVSNNLPILLAGLGGLGTGISIAITAGIALYRNWDSIAGLWKTKVGAPELADNVKLLTKEIEADTAALAKLHEKGSLTIEQLGEMNRLTAKLATEEKALASIRETEANRKSHGENANSIDKERGSAVGKSVDELGGYDAVVERFVQARMVRGGEKEEDRDSIRKAVQETLNKALKGDEGMTSALTMEASLDKTGLTGMFDLEVSRQSGQTAQRQKVKAEAEKAAKAKKKADGNPMDQAVAIEKARLKAAAEEVKEAMQSPEYKEHQEFLKRRGSLDEFGRTPDTVGFDERSAQKVQAKANADIKKAPKAEKLAPLVTDEQMQKAKNDRLKAQLSTEIGARSRGQFSPEQADAAAGEALKAMHGMGQFGLTQAGVNRAISYAMGQQLQAMQQLWAKMQQQEMGFQQVGQGFNQLHRRANQRQPSMLRSGGPS